MQSKAPAYTVAVRALCEITAKAGDLDLRFTPSPTALQGMAGHALVTSRRGPGYETEITLEDDIDLPGDSMHRSLRVRGRADGYDPVKNQIEEIKTYRGKLESIPDNHRHLHWAQVRIYGWLCCKKRGLTQIRLALVYFDIASEKETVFTELQSADALREHFELHCARFMHWAQQEIAHAAQRSEYLGALGFPYAGFRAGQRDLAEAMYRTVSQGRRLMAQAPTGIGKTLGSLFPVLKAWPAQRLDKIFFLTAKSSGRQLALDALHKLVKRTEHTTATPVRVLELVARDKACEYPGHACHGDSCPLAKGFYDRLPAARDAALKVPQIDRSTCRSVALDHQVCPYYLSQELARWSDVIVGDYNYYFDTSALLHAFTESREWRVSVLIDEAHNLVERARAMYSATLDETRLHAIRRTAPAPLKASLAGVAREWKRVSAELTSDYEVRPALPDKLLDALDPMIAAITEFSAEQPNVIEPDLLRFYFDAMHFTRIAERFGAHSLFDVSAAGGRNTTLCLRNIVPGPHLKMRFERAQSVALFSATLTPAHFYADMLGLPESTVRVDVASPFDAAQLDVCVIADVSTRYRDRLGSVQQVVDVIAAQYRRTPGNYLSFFSSFDYLDTVATALCALHPDIPVRRQIRSMSEADTRAFLDGFTETSCGIGFAVLGGSFGEGIDLAGNRLIGAFVATLGMPQVNSVNEQVRKRMDDLFGSGYDYTYLFPGLQKVVQAAGRVIRSRNDRGVLFLIDDRFARGSVRELLPSWWNVQIVRYRDMMGDTLASGRRSNAVQTGDQDARLPVLEEPG